MRRPDMYREFAQFRSRPRPKQRGPIRKYVYLGSIDYVENGERRLETRRRSGEVALEFQNADRIRVSYTNQFEFLPAPFRIGGMLLPVGPCGFDTWRLNYNMGQQRGASANLTLELGTFYDGHKTTASVARGRIPFGARLSAEPTYSINRVSLLEFTAHLAGTRVTCTMTPLMFAGALVQYNSGTRSMSTNARLRWEYRPGSELFLVYNDERNGLTAGFPDMVNRTLIVKINRLFRF